MHRPISWQLFTMLCSGVVLGCGDGGYPAEAHDWATPNDPDHVDPSTCRDGTTRRCSNDGSESLTVGICRAGTQLCKNGSFGPCLGAVTPETETCDTLDNDCDGSVDEGCRCSEGKIRSCYSGNPETRNVGECKAGLQRCRWGHLASV